MHNKYVVILKPFIYAAHYILFVLHILFPMFIKGKINIVNLRVFKTLLSIEMENRGLHNEAYEKSKVHYKVIKVNIINTNFHSLKFYFLSQL